jgi:chromate transporter
LANLTGLLPIKIFENMYRNGSMVFGGGQVLVPFLYTEFVEFKKFLSSEEFLAGYSFVQILPGPVFSFTAYVGVLAMREYGIGGEILGAFLASAGIFLPGTFLIFFLNRFWDNLKSYRVIRASLEGITASSTGMVAAAAYMLFKPIELNWFNSGFTLATFLVLLLTKIPPPYLVIAGILAGFIFYQ